MVDNNLDPTPENTEKLSDSILMTISKAGKACLKLKKEITKTEKEALPTT